MARLTQGYTAPRLKRGAAQRNAEGEMAMNDNATTMQAPPLPAEKPDEHHTGRHNSGRKRPRWGANQSGALLH